MFLSTRTILLICQVWLLCCALLAGNAVKAQSTNAAFLGVVTDPGGEPMPGATVQVQNEATGFRTATATQADGRYQLRQLPLGGPYVVTVSMIGYAAQQRKGLFLNQGDQITLKFALSEATTELTAVEVKSDRIIDQVQNFGAATSVTANQIKNLPLENRNFQNLVALSPLQGNGSLGGARSGATNITIDGSNARSPLWAGATGVTGAMPYAISQEAIREFEVSTNEYDVTQGRQAGGAVNAVTKSGTNQFSGSAFVYHYNDQLQSQYDIRGNRRTADFSRYQWGFSLGGPIIKDKLHFFTAFDRQDESRPAYITDIQSEADEARLGVRLDTLSKAIDVARRLYGVGPGPQVGQFANKTTANTLFLRLDWTLNERHKLTFRNNLTSWNSPINSGDNSDIVLRETYNSQKARSYTGLVSL
ncbi:MAG: carboxypeptidase regulatory-like domain-containing protein, partial [Cytophagales bacterium]|nr:carboxypeptidase regulatory-like domain-containing protein [Cytophagales bacterium]